MSIANLLIEDFINLKHYTSGFPTNHAHTPFQENFGQHGFIRDHMFQWLLDKIWQLLLRCLMRSLKGLLFWFHQKFLRGFLEDSLGVPYPVPSGCPQAIECSLVESLYFLCGIFYWVQKGSQETSLWVYGLLRGFQRFLRIFRRGFLSPRKVFWNYKLTFLFFSTFQQLGLMDFFLQIKLTPKSI